MVSRAEVLMGDISQKDDAGYNLIRSELRIVINLTSEQLKQLKNIQSDDSIKVDKCYIGTAKDT